MIGVSEILVGRARTEAILLELQMVCVSPMYLALSEGIPIFPQGVFRKPSQTSVLQGEL